MSRATTQHVLLLPEDCNRSCREIRARLAARTGVEAGVLIIDSLGRAWRNGTVGVALGAAGMPALLDLRGTPDLFGRELRSTEVGIADEIAAAASHADGPGRRRHAGRAAARAQSSRRGRIGRRPDPLARARPVPLRGRTMTDERFVLALAGGVGGGKFARGLAAVLPPDQLAIVVNTADDFVHLGLHISPDVDSVLYALADLNDPERGWGLAGETWNFMAALERLGGETWFKLGDRDLATHVLRTRGAGRRPHAVGGHGAARAPPRHRARGPADERRSGAQHRRDRRRRARFPGLFRAAAMQAGVSRRDVPRRGASKAQPRGFRDALDRARAIVITPSNPFVSIDPILALPGIKDALRQSRRPVVAVSPIVGGKAVKGPLGQDDERAWRRALRARRGAALRPTGRRLDDRPSSTAISHRPSKRWAAG